ncbi:hypothetical protein DSUL_20184 [Desulfovibrionales bacterium]
MYARERLLLTATLITYSSTPIINGLKIIRAKTKIAFDDQESPYFDTKTYNTDKGTIR